MRLRQISQGRICCQVRGRRAVACGMKMPRKPYSGAIRCIAFRRRK
jgi:hypothetical protein